MDDPGTTTLLGAPRDGCTGQVLAALSMPSSCFVHYSITIAISLADLDVPRTVPRIFPRLFDLHLACRRFHTPFLLSWIHRDHLTPYAVRPSNSSLLLFVCR
jgi:hypothetical protein